MKHAILIDFGSTFTKLAIVDFEECKCIFTAKFPSTVHTDARIGLNQCFEAAKDVIGSQCFEQAIKLSSSSAAGGLRMAVVGITQNLSLTAGKNAAFGAGAKILGTFSGWLDKNEIEEIENLNLEILLFCGGYEDGATEILLHNAKTLAESKISVPIIYAGNSAVAQKVRSILVQGQKECFLVRNIIPNVGELDIGPTEEIVRDVFLKRIINMKGLDKIKNQIDKMLMPTPAAVLEAGALLSKGTKNQPGLGPLMIVDIGGATTDIHSYVEPKAYEGARLLGAVEPFMKRTVEGDAGLRESSICLLEEVGCEVMAEKLGIHKDELLSSIKLRVEQTEFVATTEKEKQIDQIIAENAACISARRHAGHIEYIHSSNCNSIQIGKNLTEISTIIGTGGPIINSMKPEEILREVLIGQSENEILLPKRAKMYLDKDYIFFAAGLLKYYDEDLALTIMKNSLSFIGD